MPSNLVILISYRCDRECDFCPLWGSPRQSGTITLEGIKHVLEQARAIGGFDTISFEGGEPFLYYALLLSGVRLAARMRFRVGVITNAYWATSAAAAAESLGPLAGLVQDLTIRVNPSYRPEQSEAQVAAAVEAAARLEIPCTVATIRAEGASAAQVEREGTKHSQIALRYRGRAARVLASQAEQRPWRDLHECRCRDLSHPDRLYVDPFGNVHLCQGVSIGNVFRCSLEDLWGAYEAVTHPVVGPLVAGGPVELVLRYGLPHAATYADPCHLCYEARSALRDRFPELLLPDQVYAVV